VQDDFNFKRVHYDFKTSDLVKYEVKADFKSPETGNIFVEFEDWGHPSGIAITTADFHVFKSVEFYQIPTAVLKELVKGCRTAPARNKKTSSVYKRVGVVTGSTGGTGGVNSFSSVSTVLITLKHDAVLAPVKGTSVSQELRISGFNAYNTPNAVSTSSPRPKSISSIMRSSLNWFGG
jgi:hypothetical protein